MGEKREGPLWDALAGKAPWPPVAKLLGWTPVEVEPGSVVIAYEAREDFNNPQGFVQGGMLAAMLDDAMGPALVAMLEPGLFATTVELKVNFVRPATAGRLIARGRVVHRGRSIAFLEGRLETADGELVATSTATARIVPYEPDDRQASES
jgi:uncharacterized protein (TIGR00369 family)